MARHLEEKLALYVRMRDDKGLETNVPNLRLFIKWAEHVADYNISKEAWFLNGPALNDKSWPEANGRASCWLTPQGRVWSVNYGGHESFASDLGYTVGDMETHGWLHISGGKVHKLFAFSPTQERWVNEHFHEYKLEINDRTLDYPREVEKGYAKARVFQDAWPEKVRELSHSPRSDELGFVPMSEWSMDFNPVGAGGYNG